MKRNGDRDRMERQGSGSHRPLPIAVPDQRLRSKIADGGSVRKCYCPIGLYQIRYSVPMGQIERIERRLKLHDMRVLMSVVEAGSMAKAAERLGTSQPAVSRSIADLERTLGVRLLERSPGGVEATQYGRAISRRGVAVFDELRQGGQGHRVPCRSDCGRASHRMPGGDRSR